MGASPAGAGEAVESRQPRLILNAEDLVLSTKRPDEVEYPIFIADSIMYMKKLAQLRLKYQLEAMKRQVVE